LSNQIPDLIALALY